MKVFTGIFAGLCRFVVAVVFTDLGRVVVVVVVLVFTGLNSTGYNG